MRVLTAQDKAEASSNYRWDLFYSAICGEQLAEEIASEQIVGGLKITQAMSEAHRTGRSVLMN